MKSVPISETATVNTPARSFWFPPFVYQTGVVLCYNTSMSKWEPKRYTVYVMRRAMKAKKLYDKGIDISEVAHQRVC